MSFNKIASLAISALVLSACGSGNQSSQQTPLVMSNDNFVKHVTALRAQQTALAAPSQAKWSAVTNLSLVPSFASILPNGKVLLFSADSQFSFTGGTPGGGKTYSTIYDPNTNTFTDTLVSNTGHEMFCSGTSMLADGRLLIAGGGDAGKTSIYDSVSNTWSSSGTLNIPRAYNANTVLANGTVLTLGGSWLGGSVNKNAEVWSPSGSWSTLSGVSITPFLEPGQGGSGSYTADGHLWLIPAGNGKVFHAGAGEQMHWISTQGNGEVTSAGVRGDDVYAFHGNTVMYDTGKVLKVGGTPQNVGSPSSASSYVIDLNTGVNVRKINPMSYARSYHNSVVLPDGHVVILGGMTVGGQFTDANAVLVPEIFDPVTETFTPMPAMSVPRDYHSVAVLLADGRVLSSGGGLCGQGCAANHPDLQILSPNYLFNADGSAATRPVITSAPASAAYGSVVNVTTDSAVTAFSIVRVNSITHGVNNDQRRLSLTFSSTGANTYQVNIPSNPGWAIPGVYMLFAMNSNGTPSVSKMVTINNTRAPLLTPPGTQSSVVGSNVNFSLVAQTNGGAALTYTATNLPPGLSIDAATGLISGRPSTIGTYFPTVQVTNGTGQVSSYFEWDVNSPASLTGVSPIYGATTSGSAFSDTGNGPLTGVNLRGGSWLDNIQGVNANGSLGSHGGLGGGPLSFTVPAGQYLVRAFGTAGNTAIAQITFVSNTGLSFGPYGGGVGQASYSAFDFTVPSGAQITGLQGTAGTYVFSLGFQYGPVNSAPTLPVINTPTPPTTYMGVQTSLTLSASEPGTHTLTYSAAGLPPGVVLNASSGVMAGFPTAAGGYGVTAKVTDEKGNTASTSFTWRVLDPIPVIQPISAQAAAAGTNLSYTANAGTGTYLYSWNFGDGSPTTAFNASNTASHNYATPGVYTVTVTVKDASGTVVSRSFVQAITSGAPSNNGSQALSSSHIAVEKRAGLSDRLWVVNPDNNSVSVIDTAGNTLVSEIAVGNQPRTVAINGSTVVVTNKEAASLSVLSTATLKVVNTVNVPRGTQPYAVLIGPDGSAYISLEGTGQILKFNSSWVQTASVAAPGVRHLSMTADGSRLFASRFITAPQVGENTNAIQTSVNGIPAGGTVTEFSPANLTQVRQITVQFNTQADTLLVGKGLPNYLGALAISQDGKNAWLPSKQDNILRGTYRDGKPLDFQTTVRAITSHLNLATNLEDLPGRIFHINSGFTTAAVFHPNGAYVFVSLETSREIAVLDAVGKREILRVPAGRAPDGLRLSSDGTKLYVYNFMDRTVGSYDLNPLLQYGNLSLPLLSTVKTINTEQLAANVLLGKQYFYDAQDPRLARDSWMSCATCHNEGWGDGRVWDFTSLGEGLRNTTSLRGRAGGHGNKHWSGNFDEIQDFEGQIRSFAGGSGLMSNALFNSGTVSQPLGSPKAGLSADLDALAAYVISLNTFSPSPYRNPDGSLTTAGVAGKAIFAAQCSTCHGGVNFTNSFTFSGTATADLMNIGTLYPGSGQRLGAGALTGIDPPTLRDVWANAPYLHDGSAPTISAAITAHTNLKLSVADLALVSSYVAQIGSDEVAAPNTFVTSALIGHTGSGTAFSDAVTTGKPLTGVVIRSGWWLDSIQGVTSAGSLTAHGGTGGNPASFTVPAGQYLVRIYGISGDSAIAKISFVTNTGQVFGPYGLDQGQSTNTSFDYTVPTGNKIYGFAGSSGQYLNAIGVIYGP
ncbi:jacalin-like lectin [Undibacterium sp. SXout20W]|uniref:jacalin-like lectin n=1 Tax=Undibacterium sp. SXout20W TaxID=3413051 RepID=UPI003BF03578